MGIKKAIKAKLRSVLAPQVNVVVKQTAPNHVLQNRNVVITGGSRGLGYTIAKRCIDEGARVLITGRNEEHLKDAVSSLGANCKYICFDAQNIDGIPRFFDKAEKTLDTNKIDSLVSNAGVSLHEGDFRKVTADGWDSQFNTNLKGNYFLVTEFIKYLESKEDRRGNIVVISSERSKRVDDIPYGLTKTATNSFVQAFASKVISEGIRVNAVAPGVTASQMTGYSEDGNMYASWQPTERIFRPEEVAEVVNFLLNDVSSCISGEVITCDQGRYISHW